MAEAVLQPEPAATASEHLPLHKAAVPDDNEGREGDGLSKAQMSREQLHYQRCCLVLPPIFSLMH